MNNFTFSKHEYYLKLEKALRIGIEGLSYRIQANHDIYTCVKEQAMNYHPNLEHYRKAVFWDTDIEMLDWEKNRQWIIRRVFEYGGEEEILETLRFYGKDVVKEVLLGITDERKLESRSENIKKYLN
jgi:hypothetical protein